MEDNNDNKIFQVEPSNNYEFKYNFINIPWDDRNTRSKIGIISLLVMIFGAIVACIAYNLMTHFGTPRDNKRSEVDVACHLVKVDDYKYTARIHSIDTQELLCLGAVVSPTSVIANGVCVKAGSIRLRLGSLSDPRCRKGFSVDSIGPINHEGTFSKQVVLLTSHENLSKCSNVIQIGRNIAWNSLAYIIGRPLRGGRSLSRQPGKLVQKQNETVVRKKKKGTKVCVFDLGKCPVRAGDLLVQNGMLFGLADTSIHVSKKSNLACFADLRTVKQELHTRDSAITAMRAYDKTWSS